MPPGIGFSFQPGAQDGQLQRPKGFDGQGSTPQQAIRTLSLRVPQTQSVPGMAPLPLLNAQGGGGTDLDMLLMALLQAFGPTGGRAVGGPQTPRVRPIVPRGQSPDLRVDTPTFDREEFLRRVPGGGIGNTGRGPFNRDMTMPPLEIPNEFPDPTAPISADGPRPAMRGVMPLF